MTRPDGFPVADIDVGLLSDDRVLDAVDHAGPLAALGYLAVLTASWARGERVTYATASRRLPAVYGLSGEVLDALIVVGLLDPDGRIPAATWDSWYAPALARREARREAGRRGGLAKAANRAASTARATAASAAVAPLQRSSTLPTDRTTFLTEGRSYGASAPPANGAAARPRPSGLGSWAGKPCADPIEHGWTHVMTPAGMVCRTCTPLGDAPS